MKIILGDNQFFGVNHFDLEKGEKTKMLFDSEKKIHKFIKSSLKLGMDGFMINSNKIGYNIIKNFNFNTEDKIHYSIPYPHKYANMVNESGIISLFTYAFKNTSFKENIYSGVNLLFSKNLKFLTSSGIDLEVPSNLPKGSYVYLQNIITDLLIGLSRADIIIEFINSVINRGYKPGIITLNPILLYESLKKIDNHSSFENLIICFNVNKDGFNVFPSLSKIEEFISSNSKFKLMGMSIFASGASQIPASIDYIKQLNLDYIVFGSSKLKNVESNIKLFKR